jgi:fluoride exporter
MVAASRPILIVARPLGTTGMLAALINRYTLVMAGGAVGSLARYLLQGWGQRAANGSFPLGTLIVNVLGCFIIGALNALFTGPYPIRADYRVGVLVGVLGGFTTFSSFGWETFALANEGQSVGAIMNLLLSVALGMAAVWMGYRLVERVYGV